MAEMVFDGAVLDKLSLDELQQLLECMPGGVVVYRRVGEEILTINQAMIRIMGCRTREEFDTLTGGRFKGIVHPDDWERVQISIEGQLRQSSKKYDYVEYRVLRQDGEAWWTRDYGHLVKTTKYGEVFVVFVEDFTELHGKALDETIKGNRDDDALVKSQFEIVNALSRDYRNVYLVNVQKRSVRVLKLDGYVTSGLNNTQDVVYHYDSICEKYIQERVYSEDQDKMRAIMKLETVLAELQIEEEYEGPYRISENNEVHHCQFKYIRMSNDNLILAAFKNTDKAVAQEKKNQKVLEKALEEAEYANKAKTAFLNSVSHDIRTPMNAIVGFTGLAITHIDEKEQVVDYLHKIKTSSEHLLALINDVLEMSRIESGKLKIEPVPMCLPDLIQELETITSANVLEKKIHLQVDVTELSTRWIMADKLRLTQCLLNILSNAVKFTKQDGYICLKVKQVKQASEGKVCIEFLIKDTGIGMSRKFTKHIFEPFAREETATISGIPGTGLGMSITKNIVDAMGGKITVDSVVGKGSEFRVLIIFEVCDDKDEAVEEDTRALLQSTQDYGNKRILLAEDNHMNQEIAIAIIKDLGIMIDVVDDGLQAMERIKEVDAEYYDLILMDIQMPKMNGCEATRQIRRLKKEGASSIPIVAMTANAFEEDRQRAMTAGMNDFLTKPIDVDELQRIFTKYL